MTVLLLEISDGLAVINSTPAMVSVDRSRSICCAMGRGVGSVTM